MSTITQTYTAAPITPELVAEIDRVHTMIRQADDPRRHARDGIDLVLRMTSECLDYYFLRSTRRLGFGPVAQQAVKMGLKTALSGIGVFVRQLGKAMSAEQILTLTDMIEEMLLEVEIDPAEVDGAE
ncbi:MAG: hypothetical protein AAGE94_26160 [Acidobacteriota bacterium]